MEQAFKKILDEYEAITRDLSSGSFVMFPPKADPPLAEILPNWAGGRRSWKVLYQESGIMN